MHQSFQYARKSISSGSIDRSTVIRHSCDIPWDRKQIAMIRQWPGQCVLSSSLLHDSLVAIDETKCSRTDDCRWLGQRALQRPLVTPCEEVIFTSRYVRLNHVISVKLWRHDVMLRRRWISLALWRHRDVERWLLSSPSGWRNWRHGGASVAY